MTFAPYVTTASARRFKSETVNTDDLGFRLSAAPGGVVDTDSWFRQRRRGIVLGGSFVFGVGATCDERTVVSGLNMRSEHCFVNLGIRAGNSTQELIAAIPFLEQAECAVIASGMNTLVAGLQSAGENELFGPLFDEEAMARIGDVGIQDLTKLLEDRTSETAVRLLLRVLRQRLKGRVTPNGGRAPASSRFGARPVDFPRAAERALERHRRDLRIVARALPRGARCVFAAQPFAESSGKALTVEENRLFEAADGLQDARWARLREFLRNEYPSYVNRLGKMCRHENVTFIDLNDAPLTGWSYVDRIHLTDRGYEQIAVRLAGDLS
jgi:hypothetical protein